MPEPAPTATPSASGAHARVPRNASFSRVRGTCPRWRSSALRSRDLVLRPVEPGEAHVDIPYLRQLDLRLRESLRDGLEDRRGGARLADDLPVSAAASARADRMPIAVRDDGLGLRAAGINTNHVAFNDRISGERFRRS